MSAMKRNLESLISSCDRLAERYGFYLVWLDDSPAGFVTASKPNYGSIWFESPTACYQWLEAYSFGYETGGRDGWNAARDSFEVKPDAPAELEPLLEIDEPSEVILLDDDDDLDFQLDLSDMDDSPGPIFEHFDLAEAVLDNAIKSNDDDFDMMAALNLADITDAELQAERELDQEFHWLDEAIRQRGADRSSIKLEIR